MRGFERDSESMRFGVRINSNLIDELKSRDINLINVIKKGFDELDINEVPCDTTKGVFGTFDKVEHRDKYLLLKNKRLVIEQILLKRLLEK